MAIITYSYAPIAYPGASVTNPSGINDAGQEDWRSHMRPVAQLGSAGASGERTHGLSDRPRVFASGKMRSPDSVRTGRSQRAMTFQSR